MKSVNVFFKPFVVPFNSAFISVRAELVEACNYGWLMVKSGLAKSLLSLSAIASKKRRLETNGWILIIFLIQTMTLFPNECITVVGQKAPAFNAKAVISGEIKDTSLADYAGKNVILIFYPADFSFICPTELFAFQDKIKEFESKNTVLIAISVDQVYSHQKWLDTPRDKGGIQGITYPIVSDVNKKISSAYMTLDPQEGVALRGVFIIDTDGIIQASSIYNTSIGRDIPEVMRVLDAMLFTKEHGQVCPANWHKGDEGLKTTHEDLENYLKKKEIK